MSFIQMVSDFEELATNILDSNVCKSKNENTPNRRFYPKKIEFIMGQFYVSGIEDEQEVMYLFKYFTRDWIPLQ